MRCSTIISHKASTICRWISSKESCRRSCRGGKRVAGTIRRPRGLLALMPLLPSQEAVGQHDDRRLAMESGPQPALVVIPSQERFTAFMKFLNVPAPMGILDHLLQRHRLGKVGEVVFPLARLTPGRSFADEPTQLLTLSFQHPVGSDGHTLLAQPTLCAFPPGNRFPGRTRPFLQDHIGATTCPFTST